MNKIYNTEAGMLKYRVMILFTVFLAFFITGISSVSAQSKSKGGVSKEESFLLCDGTIGSITTGPDEDGYSECCDNVGTDSETCYKVNTGKYDAKASLKSKLVQPVMPITNLAPTKITSPRKPLKPTVIAPSNRVLTTPSVIVPNNKIIKKPTVIVPNNRTIKKTTTRTVKSAVGTSADREASKPSIMEIKKSR